MKKTKQKKLKEKIQKRDKKQTLNITMAPVYEAIEDIIERIEKLEAKK